MFPMVHCIAALRAKGQNLTGQLFRGVVAAVSLGICLAGQTGCGSRGIVVDGALLEQGIFVYNSRAVKDSALTTDSPEGEARLKDHLRFGDLESYPQERFRGRLARAEPRSGNTKPGTGRVDGIRVMDREMFHATGRSAHGAGTLGAAVERTGSLVIFVHGFGGDLNNWQFNQEALAADHTTYAIDLPGHGGSSKDLGSGHIHVGALAAAVLDFMDAKGIDKAHLVGHSLGGAVALDLALNHPERAASATLICSAGLGPEINMAYIDGFMQAKRRKQLQPVLAMLVADPAMISRDMIEDVLKFKRLDGVEAALNRIVDDTFAGGRQALELTGRLEELTVPVQVIWGRQDQVLPVAHSEGLPASIPVTVYDDAGHMAHMEKAAEVNEKLRAFIA